MSYRLVMSYSDETHHAIYGFMTMYPDVNVWNDSVSRELIFDASNVSEAKEVFSIFQEGLAKEHKKWSISLQTVRVDNGVAHRISTVCTAFSHQT